MFEDGICQVTDNFWSKQLKFTDINYQVAQADEQIAIFARYGEILNYFDPAVNIQISVHNRRIDKDDFKRSMLIKMRGDDLDEYRSELNDILLDKASQGQNSIIREKYITFGVNAETYEEAVPALLRLETDVTNNLKTIGCTVTSMTGLQRLDYMNSILNPSEPLKFSYDDLIGTGLTTKDFISPYLFDFRPDGKQTYFEMGDYYAQVLAIKKFPTEMTDELINRLSEIPCNTTINIHTNSVDNAKALEMVKTKLTFIGQDILNKQQKLIQQLSDPDMISPDLKRRKEEAEYLLKSMQDDNQRMFKGQIIVLTSAPTFDALMQNVAKLQGAARECNCELMPIAYEQEAALNATLPFANSSLSFRRTLTTASQAIFIPFTTQELFEQGGMYYGLNQLSRNLVFVNRLALKNPAGYVLGTPGSGKSFASKMEMIYVLLLTTDDDIIVIDPENEYGILCKALDGEVINVSTTTNTHFNPLDINFDYGGNDDGEDDNPLVFKTEFFLSMCEIIASNGNKGGLSGAERYFVDEALKRTYEKYLKNPKPENMPTMVDFYEELKRFDDPDARNLLKTLGLYITGSFNTFAHRTNVDINNRFVVYNIRELGEQLKTLGMWVILDQIWNRVTANKVKGKRTWFFVDEAHLLFQSETSEKFLSSLWKRARKYNAICTGITQNIEDLLESNVARKMLSNSEYIRLLNQHPNDSKHLASLLNLSQEQLGFVTNAQAGQGLIISGSSIVPVVDNFPQNTKLYKMMTTKPDEVNQIKKEG